MAVAGPTVLHCVRDWIRPSEGFVRDLVTSTTRTHPMVVTRRRWPAGAHAGVAVYSLGALEPLGTSAAGIRCRVTLLSALARWRRATLLHAHFGYWAAEVARTARRCGRPLVVSLHGHDVLVEGHPGTELDLALAAASTVIVPSHYLAGALTDRVPPQRLEVIPAGIDWWSLPFRARRPPSAGAPVRVTFAGRYVPKKGALDAARAMAVARERHPQLAACFVGSGPQEPTLRALVTELRLPATFVDGSLPGALRRCLAVSDLLVTPSRTGQDGDAESLGLVNVEAMACGVPVLSTRHGGIPEVVPADAGVLVPEADAQALAAGLIGLLDRADQWAAMGDAGRRHVIKHFDLRRRTAEVEEVYLRWT